MATTNHYLGQLYTFRENFAASGGTTTLPVPPTGCGWVIDFICLKAVTAVSVWAIDIQESDTTSVLQAGATSAAIPAQVMGPICCKMNDAPSIVLTTTGASATAISGTAHLVAGGK